MSLINESGDTIIEVLISIAVVSGVLGVAYRSVNQSTMVAIDNQERTSASKLIQSQAEYLRQLYYDDRDKLNVVGDFCIFIDGSNQWQIANVSNRSLLDNTGYSERCITNGRYYTHIRKNLATGHYLIHSMWQSASGGIGDVVLGYGL